MSHIKRFMEIIAEAEADLEKSGGSDIAEPDDLGGGEDERVWQDGDRVLYTQASGRTFKGTIIGFVPMWDAGKRDHVYRVKLDNNPAGGNYWGYKEQFRKLK
jgi:hypothetical protein